ncbi:hypothetical protein GAYE_SCF64G6703 [Galdieria yellowstonensis]|uniref:Peptidyl-prolyl cis-trans isomerase n=1 Tax=Galdieria yellowstonensis TaxID=3028027 RepID=A0AAV9IMU1_9RHOD|nr:hypothetical protein GAYE_SCF64G6703 [Galdieria yellowstonensis]
MSLAALGVLPLLSSSSAVQKKQPVITDRVYFDISVGNEYIGRMVFDLYGKDAPETVSTFLQFLKGLRMSDRSMSMEDDGASDVIDSDEQQQVVVSYDFSLFYRCSPGFLLEGGKIPNLGLTTVGDTTFYDVGGSLINAKPQLETNSLKHSERGLLTRKIFRVGPEFAITLAERSDLDASYTVFGKLEKGYDVLQTIENLPVIADNRRENNSLSSQLFQWQRNLFLSLGRDVFHDRRADEIYPNKLLRRVAVIGCGLL